MTTFWLLTVVLSIGAVCLLLWPWLFKGKYLREAESYSAAERVKANIRIFKERNRELSAELEAGRISAKAYQELKQELDESLLQDAETNEPSVQNQSVVSSKSWFLLACLSFALVGVSYTLYKHFGAADLVAFEYESRFSEGEIAEARALADSGDTRGVLVKLRDKLSIAANSGDVEGWMLLARTAMNVEQFDIAAEAYGRLAELEGDEAKIQASLYGLQAQALFFEGQAIDSAAVSAVLDKAFSLDKNEVNSIGLLAIASFTAGKYQDAINHWQKMLVAAPNHPSRSSIEQGIARAQFALGESKATERRDAADVSSAPSSNAAAEATSGADGITIRVTLSEALKADLSGEETLFVFARAVAGPPIPLAVVRHSVEKIPAQILLNDDMAMMPSMKLSMFDEVDVVARVTKSGTAKASIGDYEFVVTPVPTADAKAGEINIELDVVHLIKQDSKG